MNDCQIDARKWRFLDNPRRYLKREPGGLEIEPLVRQFKTAKEILSRIAGGRGVLLADDVGLGKTTVGALVAWVVAARTNASESTRPTRCSGGAGLKSSNDMSRCSSRSVRGTTASSRAPLRS